MLKFTYLILTNKMANFVIVQFSTTVYAQSNPSKSIKPDLLIRPNSLTATELVIYIVRGKICFF